MKKKPRELVKGKAKEFNGFHEQKEDEGEVHDFFLQLKWVIAIHVQRTSSRLNERFCEGVRVPS